MFPRQGDYNKSMENRKNPFLSSHTPQDEQVFPRDLPAVSIPVPPRPSEASTIPGRAWSPGARSSAPAGRPQRPAPPEGCTASPSSSSGPARPGEGHGPLPAPAPRSPPRHSHKPGTGALRAAHEPQVAQGLKKDGGEAPSSSGGRRPLPGLLRPRQPPAPLRAAPRCPRVSLAEARRALTAARRSAARAASGSRSRSMAGGSQETAASADGSTGKRPAQDGHPSSSSSPHRHRGSGAPPLRTRPPLPSPPPWAARPASLGPRGWVRCFPS